MKKKTTKAARQPKPKKVPSPQTAFSGVILPWAILVIAMLFVVIVRARLADLPLERDEGEYAYMGQCMLDGILPYEEASNMKLPGTYYMYAVIMAIFGQSPDGIRTGLLLVNLLSMFLLFLVGKKFAGTQTGAITAASFGLLATIPGTFGLAAHATHFIALFTIAGLLALLNARENKPVFFTALGGFMFGMAFIMKQQAVFLLIFGGLYLLLNERKSSPKNIKSILAKLGVYSAFAVLPYLLILLAAILTGSFGKFWHWTVEYASQYTSIQNLGAGYKMFQENFQFITTGAWGLWLAGMIGAITLFKTPAFKQYRFGILLFAFLSFLTTVPGLLFRNHYFIAFFPALALLIGAAFKWLDDLMSRWQSAFVRLVPALLFASLAFYSIHYFRKIYFDLPATQVSTQLYGRNPFVESLQVADFIRKNTLPGERIVVFGSEPQIYFYSQRKAATSYLYTYPLMENQPYHRAMQEEMKSEIERNKPKYFIGINVPFSWLKKPGSDTFIMDWANNFTQANYHAVGFVDIISPGQAHYVWGKDINTYQARGESSIVIMERN